MKQSIIESKISNKIVSTDSLPKGVVKISFSQYNVFKSCPYRWYLTYGKKLYPFSSSVDTVFGTALHETLQKYIHLLYKEGVGQSNKFNYSEFLLESLKKNYKLEKEKNDGNHFTDSATLHEYYEDGIEIMRWIVKNRIKIFDNKNIELVGIEIPILTKVDDNNDNIWFTAFLDIVFYDKINDTYLVIDAKTSKEGWNKYAKKDENKIAQLLLYKKFFSKQFGVPEDKIEVEFMICRRKIMEDAPYPIPRVQRFVPANGALKVKQAFIDVTRFIHECYDYDGNIVEKQYSKDPGDKKKNCRFCPFNGTELCDGKKS